MIFKVTKGHLYIQDQLNIAYPKLTFLWTTFVLVFSLVIRKENYLLNIKKSKECLKILNNVTQYEILEMLFKKLFIQNFLIISENNFYQNIKTLYRKYSCNSLVIFNLSLLFHFQLYKKETYFVYQKALIRTFHNSFLTTK